jgi:hypothetical protein
MFTREVAGPIRAGPKIDRYSPYENTRYRQDDGGMKMYDLSSGAGGEFSREDAFAGTYLQTQEENLAIQYRAGKTPENGNLMIEGGEMAFCWNPPHSSYDKNAPKIFSLGQLNVLLRDTSLNLKKSPLFSKMIYGGHDSVAMDSAGDIYKYHDPSQYTHAQFEKDLKFIEGNPRIQPLIVYHPKLIARYFKFLGFVQQTSSVASSHQFSGISGTRNLNIAVKGVVRGMIDVWLCGQMDYLYLVIGRRKRDDQHYNPIQIWPVSGKPHISHEDIAVFEGHVEIIYVGKAIEVPMLSRINKRDDISCMRVAGIPSGDNEKYVTNFQSVQASVSIARRGFSVVVATPGFQAGLQS